MTKARRDIFQALADPTRRAILVLLSAHTLTPNAMAEHFNISRQAVSKHIHILMESELLLQEHRGREIHYSLILEKMREVEQWLTLFKAQWEVKNAQLDTLLENLKNTEHDTTI